MHTSINFLLFISRHGFRCTVISQYISDLFARFSLCKMHKLISIFQFVNLFLLVWSPSSHKPIIPGSCSWQLLIPNRLKYAECHGIPEQSAQKQHYCIMFQCSCRFSVKFAFLSHNNFNQLNLKACLCIMVPKCTGVANRCWTLDMVWMSEFCCLAVLILVANHS